MKVLQTSELYICMIGIIMVTLNNDELHCWRFASSREPGIFVVTIQCLSHIAIYVHPNVTSCYIPQLRIMCNVKWTVCVIYKRTDCLQLVVVSYSLHQKYNSIKQNFGIKSATIIKLFIEVQYSSKVTSHSCATLHSRLETLMLYTLLLICTMRVQVE